LAGKKVDDSRQRLKKFNTFCMPILILPLDIKDVKDRHERRKEAR